MAATNSGEFKCDLPLNFINGKRVECSDPGEVFDIEEPATGNMTRNFISLRLDFPLGIP